MARLDITVRGLDQLQVGGGRQPLGVGGSLGVADLQRTETLLQRQNKLVIAMARGAADFGKEMLRGVSALDTRLKAMSAGVTRTRISDEDRLKREREKKEADYWRGVERWNRRMLQARMAGEREYARERDRLARASERAEEAAARRRAALLRAGVAGAGGAVGGSIGAAGRVLGSAGTGFGTVLGGLGTGGLGGIVRSAGSIGAIGAQTFGGLANAFAPTAGRGAGFLGGGALGAILGGGAGAKLGSAAGDFIGGTVGRVAGVGAQVAGSLAGGAAQLAGNIGGEIVDKVLGVVKIGVAAGIGGTIGAAIRGAKLEQTENAFQGLARTIGTTSTRALEGFREASRGTISDLELMIQANRAVVLGAVDTAQQFEEFITVSRRLGQAVGRDAGDALEDFTLGVARQSRQLLDNIGLTVRAESAYESMAERLGKTSSELTDAERRAAFLAATMDASRSKIGAMGKEVETLGANLSRLRAGSTNAFDAFAKGLTPALTELSGALVPVVKNIGAFIELNRGELGDKLLSAVKALTGGLSGLGESLRDAKVGTVFDAISESASDLWKRFQVEGAAAATVVKGHLLAAFETVKGEIGTLNPFSDSAATRGAAGSRARLRIQEAELEAEGIRGKPKTFRERVLAENRFRDLGLRGDPFPDRGIGGFEAPSFGISFTGTQRGRPVSRIPAAGQAVGVAREVGLRSFGPDAGTGGPLLRLGEEFGKLPPVISELTVSSEAAAKALRAFDLAEARKSAIEASDVAKNLRGVGAAIERKEAERARVEDQLIDATRRRLDALEGIRIREVELEEMRLRKVGAIIDAMTSIPEKFLQSFRSTLPGSRGDPALPGNIRRGFERAEGLERRSIRNQLRSEFGHLSSAAISESPELLATIEARTSALRFGASRPLEAAREIAAGREFSRPGPLRAESDKASAAAIAEIEASTKAAVAAKEAEVEALKAAVKSTSEMATVLTSAASKVVSELEKLKAEQEKVKRQFERLEAILNTFKS